jgi:hypothetical protein
MDCYQLAKKSNHFIIFANSEEIDKNLFDAELRVVILLISTKAKPSRSMAKQPGELVRWKILSALRSSERRVGYGKLRSLVITLNEGPASTRNLPIFFPFL